MPNIADALDALAERKARKVQQLIALLRDPELAEYTALLTGGTNGIVSHAGKPRLEIEAGGVREAIRATLSVLPDRFTSADVCSLLKQRDYPFSSKDPLSSVRDQLHALYKQGEIRVVKQGKGGKPNVYRRAKAEDGPRQPRSDILGEPPS